MSTSVLTAEAPVIPKGEPLSEVRVRKQVGWKMCMDRTSLPPSFSFFEHPQTSLTCSHFGYYFYKSLVDGGLGVMKEVGGMGGGRNGLAAQQELIVKTHMVIVLHTPCSQASPTNYASAGYYCVRVTV